MSDYNYDMAFSRNIGWVTDAEQSLLKSKKIAIAGLGGVGESCLESLARLGIESFNIADFSMYEMQNFNRQNNAIISTLNLKISTVLKNKLNGINPAIEFKTFEKGLSEKNLDEFLEGVDLYIDGLDLFAIDIRILLFKRLKELNIPAITIAPMGMGAAMLVFQKGSMSFENYFGMTLESTPGINNCRFISGFTPSLIQKKYLVDFTQFKFSKRRVPSTSMGCLLAAAMATTNALKILLKRGVVLNAPWSMHFDPYLNTYKKKYIMFGHKNPFQRYKLKILKKLIIHD